MQVSIEYKCDVPIAQCTQRSGKHDNEGEAKQCETAALGNRKPLPAPGEKITYNEPQHDAARGESWMQPVTGTVVKLREETPWYARVLCEKDDETRAWVSFDRFRGTL